MGWLWLAPAGAGIVEMVPGFYGATVVADCTEELENDSTLYDAAAGVLIEGDPPCMSLEPRYSFAGGLAADRGEASFHVPIGGGCPWDLKGYSVVIKFDPSVFTVNPDVVDTIGTAAVGAVLVTSGHTDTTAHVEVVYSVECPPQVEAGERPPRLPFIDFVLDIKETAPSGSTLIRISDAGLYRCEMTTCEGSVVRPDTLAPPDFYSGYVEIGGEVFIRGDDDGDGELTITDPIMSLCAQFADCDLDCFDASDVDDNGEITISDPIYNLAAQFSGGPEPPAPFPMCGKDPTTGDTLNCDCHSACMDCVPMLTESDGEVRMWLGEPEQVDAGRLSYPVYLETTEPLLGFDCTVEFPDRDLAFVRSGTEMSVGRSHDFLSASEGLASPGIGSHGKAGRGRVRLGDVVSLDMTRSLEPGRHRVANLEFRTVGDAAADPAVTGGHFVAVGLEKGLVLAGAPAGAGSDGQLQDLLKVSVAPNPVTDKTSISYGVPVGGRVSVVIYSVAGQAVRTLVDGYESPGVYEVVWTGHSDSGSDVPGGIYFCRVRTPVSEETVKMVIPRP
jgi:hypothetical protein